MLESSGGHGMSDLITRTFNSVSISQRRSDGYFDATAMCKAAGKKWSHYLCLDGTKDFLQELSCQLGIPVFAEAGNTASEQNQSLIRTRKGGTPDEQGTWVHPQVAYHLAQWCSPAFAVQVTFWIDDIRNYGFTGIGGAEAVIGAIRTAVLSLQAEVAELRAARDPRIAVLDFISVRELLDQAKALPKGRNGLNRRIGNALRRLALKDGVSLRQCPRTGTWLFPAEFGRGWMRTHGAALVRQHNDAAIGQGVLRFPDRRPRSPDAPDSATPSA